MRDFVKVSCVLKEGGYVFDMMIETPSLDLLPGLLSAMDEGYSPNTSDVTPAEVAIRRSEIRMDEEGFVDKMIGARDPQHMSRMPAGRLPSLSWWVVEDGVFLGSVQLRWQEGTHALPAHVLGHIGYAIRPSARGKGIGTLAARHACQHAFERGMEHVEIACKEENIASRRIIENLGGACVKTFVQARKVVFVYKVMLDGLRF